MKSKTTKVRRYLAAILTVLMIFQQATTSVIYASSEAAVPTVTEAPAAQTEETPEKQVEETPEEKTPTEGENEGEESAAPTEAPTENEAEPEVTVTPAAEPTATEAPAVEATATPVPEATEVPEATPTEVPTAASFTTADGIASVNLTQPIPANAKFVATAQDADSDYFYNNVDAAMGAWVESNGLSVVDATAYDMHFEADGQELAVNQSATVHINFPAPILTQKPETGIQTTYYVLHIKNGTAVPAGTVNGDANGVYSADITTDGFSPFVFVKVASGDAIQLVDTAIKLENALKIITATTVGGKVYDPTQKYPRDAEIQFNMSYGFDEGNKPKVDGVKTATYTLPQGLSVSDASGPIDCEGYTAGHAGTYTISGGIVTFEYTEAFLTAHPSGIEGTFRFSGKLSEENTNNAESATIEFQTKGTTIPITFKLEEGKVETRKTYTLNSDGTIDFSINLKVSGKDVQNVQLTDTQGSNLAFADDPQFKLDGVLIDASKIRKQENKVSLNLGNLNIGEHILTYKAKLIDYTKAGDSNKNHVECTWNGNEENKGQAETTVQITTQKELKKSGTVNKESKEITWTVIYVPGQLWTAAGKTFKDTLGNDQKYIGKYEVYYDENGSIYYCDGIKIAEGDIGTGTSFSYTFPATQTATKGAYKIIYKTKITKDLSNSQTEETFTNTISGDGKEATGTAKIDDTHPALPTLNIVKKSGVANSDDRKATWTVTVTPPTGKTVKNLMIVDELLDHWNWFGKYVEDNITVKEGETTLTKDVDYSIAFVKSESRDKNPKMTVTFKKDITNTVTMEYQSDYSESTTTGYVGNKIKSHYKIDDNAYSDECSASVEFKKTNLVLNKTGELSTGVATWKIVINDINGSNRVELSEDVKSIVDTIPEGMEYVDGTLKCNIDTSHWNEDNPIPYNDVTVLFDKVTRELKIRINNLNLAEDRYAYIELEYQTRITNIPKKSGNGVTINGDQVTFTNRVEVGEKTDNAEVIVTNKELTKSGKQINGLANVVEYNIGVNYGAVDLLPGSDSLELDDELDINLTLDPSSIKVTDMNTGEDVAYRSSFGTTADGKNTMKLSLPDERALVVTYRASLVTAGKEKDKNYEVSNKATLKGKSEKSEEVKTFVKYEESAATITGTANSITIKKVDESGNVLSGAKFVVQKVNPTTLEAEGNATTLETKNGLAKFENLNFNTLYYYQEIKAPDNYQIKDKSKHYFVIKNQKNSIEFDSLVNSISADTKYAVLSGGQTFIVENQKVIQPVEAQITASKTVNGEAATGSQFSFKLIPQTEGDKNKEQTVSNQDGNITFGKLTYESTGIYEYEVSEVQDGLPTGYSADTTIHKVTVEVTDKDGKLVATVKYTDADKAGIVFANQYKPGAAEAQITASKTVNGKAATGSQFSFKLIPQTEGDTNKEQTVSNQDGNITFGKLTYESTGIYEYEVSEVQDGLPTGYSADKTTHKVKVEVTDKDGKLVATVIYADADKGGIVFKNTYETLVKVSKVDITSQKELAGAHIQILDKDGNVVEEWDSTDKAHTIKGLKTGEKYTLRETVAPNGYYLKADTTFALKADGSIDTEKTTTTISKEGILLVEDTAIPTPDVPSGPTAKISKVDVTSQQELEGAKLQVIDKNGNVVDEWISGKTAHVTTELKAGETYTLRETVAPDGYLITSDTTFTLKEDGTVDESKTTTKVKDGVLLVEDTKAVSVNISKVDATNQKELEGAHIQIVDKDGKIVDEWTSGKEPHVVNNLKPGETYILRETIAPDGYTVTSDTTFTLKEDGTVDQTKTTATVSDKGVVLVEDNMTSVSISKVDITSQKELAGAHIQILDKDGNVVEEWDSTDKAHTIKGLKTGETYTLRETVAPKGYKVAEDTTFQLNEDGTIDTENTTTAISDDTLLVKDEKKESKDVSVSVTKKLVTVDGTVIGAVDATYYVALYSDADCTERVSDVLALNFKNASSSTVTFTGLEKGQTYYVGECEADGTCYLANICADGTMYMVDFSDGNAVTVDNADGSTTVYFDNQFEKIPDGYYKEAELNITKKLVGSDGKAKNSNEIFYAGIFADEGFTQLSTDVSQNIVPLDLAGGSEATALVNVALPESGSITLYVTEVDSNGKPVAGAASFKYDVTVDNAQVTLNDDNLSANVVITNTENSTKVTPTPSTPNTPNTTGGFSGKSAVRTGDSTPIGGFIALFAAAAVIAGAAVFFKRRRKDEK